MAISSKNLSVEGVEEILQAGNDAYRDLFSNNEILDKSANILQAIERIQKKIDSLHEREEEVLQKFTAPNDRGSIQKRIDEYRTKDFKNFFGDDLRKIFINDFNKAIKAHKDNKAEQQNALAELILERVLNSNPITPKAEQTYAEAVAKEFARALGVVNAAGGTSVTRKNVIGVVEGTKDNLYIIVEDLSKTARERLQTYLNQLNNKKSKKELTFKSDILKGITLDDIKTKSDSLELRFKSEWLQNTQMMSGSDIDAAIERDPKYIEIRNQVNENIIALLKRNVSSKVQNKLEIELRERLKQYPNLFYVGTASTAITGLLGELAAVIAIKDLTGVDVSLEWVADNLQDGKKVSIDIVLKHTLDIDVKEGRDDYGINVKNSSTTGKFSSSKKYGITFAKRDPEAILNTLLSQQAVHNAEALSNAFQTSYFNLSYQIFTSRPHVRANSNKVFDKIEDDLIDFRETLISFLYQFAPEMLFMETDEVEKALLVLDQELESKMTKRRGNILYLVQGQIYFPSEMLLQLKEELQSMAEQIKASNNFRQSSLFSINTNNKSNIISLLNDRAIRGESVALRDFNSTYNLNMVIPMKSSWRFGK